jgi:hypothetical protein
MKNLKKIFICFLFFTTRFCFSQLLQNDSLNGFDINTEMRSIYLRGFEEKEAKTLLKIKQREFIHKKYPTTLVSGNIGGRIIRPGNVANAPCINEGFEGAPIGTLSASSGWSVNTQPINWNTNTYLCGPVTFSNVFNSSYTSVSLTPISNSLCNNVPHSPLGGNKIINMFNSIPGPTATTTKMYQTFSVTSTNFNYLYCYKAILQDAGTSHYCCEHANISFNFYDCSNTLLTTLGNTLIPGYFGCSVTPISNWTSLLHNSIGFYFYTPNWEIKSVNLIPYIGSCITVEVVASNCSFGGHYGQLYYDSYCSNQIMLANNNFVMSNSHTICTTTATLAGMPGLNAYTWQGPLSSSVTGSTNSIITTSVSGNYTLTAQLGTLSITQITSLSINPFSAPSVSGNSVICFGNSLQLQLNGNGLSTYTWNTGAQTASVLVSPGYSNNYTVVSTNSLGCPFTNIITPTVLTTPTIGLSSALSSVCAGDSNTLIINSSSGTTYTWSNGAQTTSIIVNPTANSTFSAIAQHSSGCTSTTAINVTVEPLPLVQIVATSASVCPSLSTGLIASPVSSVSYLWSNASTSQSIVVSPSTTSVYNLSVTSNYGCKATSSYTVFVNPLPTFQIVAQPSIICLGEQSTLTLSGQNINSQVWSNSSTLNTLYVQPISNTVYSVVVSSAMACSASAQFTLIVNPIPQVSLSITPTLICVGETATLTPVFDPSVVSYTWSHGATNSVCIVSPIVNTNYSLSVTNSSGCTIEQLFNVMVDECTGLKIISENQNQLKVFPNPAHGGFTIKSNSKVEGKIVNDLGQLIMIFVLEPSNNFKVFIENLSVGYYTVSTNKQNVRVLIK